MTPETRRGFLAYVSVEPGVYLMAGRSTLFIYWWLIRVTQWLCLFFAQNFGRWCGPMNHFILPRK